MRRPPLPELRPFHLLVAALCVLAAGFYVAPQVCFLADFRGYWLRWAQSTGGTEPWQVYLRRFPSEVGPAPANYPPFVPYLLTLAEAVRRANGTDLMGGQMLVYVKLPFLLAQVVGGAVCLWGLAPVVGRRRASWAALAYLLCPALFVNAAVWGQADTLLALAVTAVLAALVRDRPVLAGALFGWGVSVKLQIVVFAPVVLLWALRRYGGGTVAAGGAAGVAAAALVALPHLLHGAGPALLRAYTGAASYYTDRSMNMHNGWFVLDMFDCYVRDLSGGLSQPDTGRVVGPLPITWYHLGLALYASYLCGLCAWVWRRRRPTARLLLLACLLSAYAFAMLPTRMHERYLLPAAAVLALALPLSGVARRLFPVFCVTLTLDQMIILVAENAFARGAGTRSLLALHVLGGVALSILYVLLFVWTTRAVVREVAQEDDLIPAPGEGTPAGPVAAPDS
jgi:hypothetical protein